jgi:hypothetical protein
MSQYRNSALNTAPTAFSYTPTGRAIPSSAPLRTPARRPSAPSCTPTGRVVLSTPAARRAA